MISVDEALALIDTHRPYWGTETIALHFANRRRLAEDIIAPFKQPRHSVSIMDGYAMRKNDLLRKVKVVGESRAGAPFEGQVHAGQAVRIFTGAILPEGANCVEIQEHAKLENDWLSFVEVSENRHYIRDAGSDFRKGDILFKQGTIVTPAIIMALSSANLATVQVERVPTVGLLRGGDELKPIGSVLNGETIIDSIGPGLLALFSDWSISVVDLGIATDDPSDIKARIHDCDSDIIVPIGGASVGDYDFMKGAFQAQGFEPIFRKIAVKPGKPTWFSKRQNQCVLGLPGNPSSAWVCTHIFLSRLIGRPINVKKYVSADDIPSNGNRETYLRARLKPNGTVSPLSKQDSGLVLPLTQANILIKREVSAPPVKTGSNVEGLTLF